MKFKMAFSCLGCVSVVLYSGVLATLVHIEDCMDANWCAVRNWQSFVEYVLVASLILFILGLRHEMKGGALWAYV